MCFAWIDAKAKRADVVHPVSGSSRRGQGQRSIRNRGRWLKCSRNSQGEINSTGFGKLHKIIIYQYIILFQIEVRSRKKVMVGGISDKKSDI
jgi:hypothetical protein